MGTALFEKLTNRGLHTSSKLQAPILQKLMFLPSETAFCLEIWQINANYKIYHLWRMPIYPTFGNLVTNMILD